MRPFYDYNQLLMESYMEIVNSQDVGNKFLYRAALESTEPAGRARLVSKLYEICLRPTNVDYGKIPDSRGNILKLSEYDTTAKAIEILNDLMKIDNTSNEIKILNDFYDMLIKCREDFEYGYKYNIEIIKVLYCNMVRSLYELIDMCIASYAMYIKNKEVNKPSINPVRKTDTILLKSVKGILASYKKGEWQKLMTTFKDPKVAAVGESYIEMSINAMKYSNDYGVATEDASSGHSTLDDAFKTIKDKSSEFFLNSDGKLNKFGWTASVIAFIGGAILVLNALRGLIRFFMRKSSKLSTYLENQAELIKGAIDAEVKRGDTSDKIIERQKKWYSLMKNMAEFINVHILKANSAAERDISSENKSEFKDILNTNDDLVFM